MMPLLITSPPAPAGARGASVRGPRPRPLPTPARRGVPSRGLAPSSTRARALGLARRLAAGALQRVAREVDRLSQVLEPLRGAIPLREPGPRVELEVTRRAAPAWTPPEPPSAPPEPASAPPSERPLAPAPPSVALPPAIEQVAHLRARIEPPLARLRELAAWEGAEDPADAIRRVRVATRRLRAFVRLFAPLLGDKRARKLERRLRAVTRALGPMREHDVLLAGLRAEHTGAEPLVRAALEHVTAWAEGQRRKAVRRTSEALADVDAPALAAALDDELDRVCGRLLRLDDALPTHAAAWIEPELARAFEGMPKAQDDADLDALHDVRIRAKRLRYALELLRPMVPELHRSLRPPLRRLQSTLGEHREAAQLLDRLHARREALGSQGLHTLASALEPVEAAARHRRQHAFERAMRALEGLPARGGADPSAGTLG
jgi:CHAD domain-containing protein